MRFREKSYVLDLGSENSKKRLRSGNSVEPTLISNRFLLLIARDVELTLAQLEKHAVFVRQRKILSNSSDWSGRCFMHLKQICSVCQVSENDYGTDTDGLIFTMYCGHTLHRDCFDSLPQKNCPLCRNSSLINTSSSTSNRAFSYISSTPVVVTPYPTCFIPRWDVNDNALLAYPYQILDNGYTARPTKGMLILHTEPFTPGFFYKFSIYMSSAPYCAAALLIGSKQDRSARDFGSNYDCCSVLREKIGKDKVDFVIDMVNKTAKYRYHNGDGEVTINNIQDNVYLAIAVKYNDGNCYARIMRTDED